MKKFLFIAMRKSPGSKEFVALHIVAFRFFTHFGRDFAVHRPANLDRPPTYQFSTQWQVSDVKTGQAIGHWEPTASEAIAKAIKCLEQAGQARFLEHVSRLTDVSTLPLFQPNEAPHAS